MNTAATLTDRDEEIDLLALVRMLWGYKYHIIFAGVVCGAIAAAIALVMTPVFRAEVVILEVRDQSMDNVASLAKKLGGLADVAGMGSLGSGGATAQAQAVLRSRRLVEEFILRHKLQSQMLRGDKAAAKLANPDAALWFAVKDFQDNVLSIRDDKRGSTTIVAVDWTDAAVAAQWANEIVALTNEMVRNRAIEESKRSIEYLSDQVPRTNVVEVQRVMYNLIEQETKKLTLANTRAEYAFAVVDPAVPSQVRLRPRRAIMVLVGIALGGVLGILAAFAHNSITGRSRTSRPAS